MTIVACQTKIWRSKKVPFLGLRTLKSSLGLGTRISVQTVMQKGWPLVLGVACGVWRVVCGVWCPNFFANFF